MLRGEKVLGGKELFRYRRESDKTVPHKGGAKGYAPDGSWLQAKHLEVFHQERAAVLGEQRVERLGSLVQGEWNPSKKLVEFKKEVGKFWSHMGFVDQSRKWLYPEEALYLMETTVMEVYCGAVPLSIQEAYTCMIGSDMSLDEYQTYAHLRRLGYVVLRHLGKPEITPYERQIKLDQHIKENRRRRKHRDREGQSTEDESTEESEGKKQKLQKEAEHAAPSHTGEQAMQVDMTEENVKDKVPVSHTPAWVFEGQGRPANGASSRHCGWDLDNVFFPNIAGKEKVVLTIPDSKYLPVNVVLSEEFEDICLFDVHEYRQRTQSRRQRRENESSHVYSLDFSYAHWMKGKKKLQAKNWTEYKQKCSALKLGENEESPVSHLWQGDVTPLVKPEDATSTKSLLDKLQVIQSVDLPCPDIKSDRDEIKISFDVHLPNAKFKKTQPGLPNHRVCVVRSCDNPPSLADVSDVVNRYGDKVAVNWAVVDNGDIAFYSFASVSLPVDVMMG